jgi:hypothetical protein
VNVAPPDLVLLGVVGTLREPYLAPEHVAFGRREREAVERAADERRTDVVLDGDVAL